MRGSSVRNSSWLNSTRTLLAVERALAQVVGLDAVEVDVADEARHLAVLEHAVLRLAEVRALLRRQLVEVFVDRLRGRRRW